MDCMEYFICLGQNKTAVCVRLPAGLHFVQGRRHRSEGRARLCGLLSGRLGLVSKEQGISQR